MGEDWESPGGFVSGGRGVEGQGGDPESHGRMEAVCLLSTDFPKMAKT